MEKECLDDIKISFFESMWFRIINFFNCWIYPAPCLKNFLFHRYDLVRIREFKPYEFYDFDQRILYSSMNLICEFIEGNPEKHVCWYKDEEGNDVGPRFYSAFFKEYNDVYVLDVVKEIYEWWKCKLSNKDELTNDLEYIKKFAFDYVYKKHYYEKSKTNDHWILTEVGESRKSIKEATDINYEILRKYFNSDEELTDEKIVNEKIISLDNKIYVQETKYIVLSAEIRSFLWT